jgi:hypothetical protein
MVPMDTTTAADATEIARRTLEFYKGDRQDALFAARRAGMPAIVIAAIQAAV